MNGKLEGSTKIEHASASQNPAPRPPQDSTNMTTQKSPTASTDQPTSQQPAPTQPASPTQTAVSAQPHQNAQRIQFHSGQIEAKSTKKIDPFAKQNQEAEQKKQKDKKKKQVGIIIGSIAGILAVAGVAVAIVLFVKQKAAENNPNAPTISNGSTESVIDLKQLAENAYNGNDDNNATEESVEDLSAAEKVYDDAIAASRNKEYIAQMQLSKLIFYSQYGYNEKAIEMKDEVDVANLSESQKAIYYNMLSNAYSAIGNTEEATKYQNQAMNQAKEENEIYGR